MSLTVTSTDGIRRGMHLSVGGGPEYRVSRVVNGTTLTIRTLLWHERLWRFLTTAPNGDATEWMR